MIAIKNNCSYLVVDNIWKQGAQQDSNRARHFLYIISRRDVVGSAKGHHQSTWIGTNKVDTAKNAVESHLWLFLNETLMDPKKCVQGASQGNAETI